MHLFLRKMNFRPAWASCMPEVSRLSGGGIDLIADALLIRTKNTVFEKINRQDNVAACIRISTPGFTRRQRFYFTGVIPLFPPEAIGCLTLYSYTRRDGRPMPMDRLSRCL